MKSLIKTIAKSIIFIFTWPWIKSCNDIDNPTVPLVAAIITGTILCLKYGFDGPDILIALLIATFILGLAYPLLSVFLVRYL